MSDPSRTAQPDVSVLFEAALREQVQAGCPGAILTVSAPKMDCFFSGAFGLFARGSDRKLSVDDAFRVASVTKAVTAATAVRLASMNRWDLDGPITAFLPLELVQKMRQLGSLMSPRSLTPRILLSHSSGLPDYFFDPRFQEHVKAGQAR